MGKSLIIELWQCRGCSVEPRLFKGGLGRNVEGVVVEKGAVKLNSTSVGRQNDCERGAERQRIQNRKAVAFISRY